MNKGRKLKNEEPCPSASMKHGTEQEHRLGSAQRRPPSRRLLLRPGGAAGRVLAAVEERPVTGRRGASLEHTALGPSSDLGTRNPEVGALKSKIPKIPKTYHAHRSTSGNRGSPANALKSTITFCWQRVPMTSRSPFSPHGSRQQPGRRGLAAAGSHPSR